MDDNDEEHPSEEFEMSKQRNIVRALGRCRSGAAAVEFAIVAPVFLLILFGMIAFGLYLGTAHSVEELAAGAARVAVAGISTEERTRLARSYIERNAGQYTLIDNARIKASIADSTDDKSQFIVRIEYDASQLPIYKLYSGLPVLNSLIVRTSTIQIGGV